MLRRRGVPVADARRYDAIVVGAGPNGLAAAITLARAGRSVRVLEARPTVGGGTRSAALTLPGFVHDVCSAIIRWADRSPVFAAWPLAEHGLEWIEPPVALAHPLDDGSAAGLPRRWTPPRRGLARTAKRIGACSDRSPATGTDRHELLGRCGPGARHPFAAGRFGLNALQPVTWLARRFRTPAARALLAGVGAHSFVRAREADHRRLRPVAAGQRPRRRLADPPRRLAAHRRCAGLLPALAGRRDRHRTAKCAAWTGCRPIGRCCST